MFRSALVIFGLIRVLYVAAQPTDSLHRLPVGVDSISAFQLQQVHDQPVWLAALPNGYNRIMVTAAFDKGRFIPAQGSTQTQDYRVAAEGKTTWQGVQLYGRFGYGRTLEDSTRLRHQTRINPTAPVYFGSLRYNRYERSVYTFAVAAQRDAAHDNLPVTAALDYRVGEHFSNNDPRGGINDFQLNVLAGLGYRTGSWEYHLAGRYGYGRERVQIAYKNEKYTQNTENPLYVNWYMNGYGNAVQRISNDQRRYDDDFRRFGADGHVCFEGARLGTWKLDAGWLRETQRFKRLDSSPQTYTLLNDYTLDRWSAALSSVWRQQDTRTIQADLRVALDAGHDDEPFYQAKNYTYRKEFADAGVRVSGARWHYGIRAGYEFIEQQDGVAGISNATSGLLAHMAGGYRFHMVDANFIGVNAVVGYRYALDNELVFPILAESPLSTHVVYHDYLYRASSAMQYQLSCSYAFSTAKSKWWEIAASADYCRRGELPDHAFTAPSVPGKDLFGGQLRLSWFF